MKKYKREYEKRRRALDPAYRAIQNARLRIRKMLIGKIDFSTLLGCSSEEFRYHIQCLFTEGMSWDNYGKWHIDHKFPLSVALSQGDESFKKACHHTNTQPLWAIDNLKKGKKHG